MVDSIISIIIPTYNRCSLMGATLDSIITQQYKNWECIVVDDGSIDYTKELMEFYCLKDCRIHYFARPINRKKGASACRNYGFELSKGDYINWFDSDDIMHPEFLVKKLSFLQNQEGAVCSISTFYTFKFEQKKIIYLEKSSIGFTNIFQNICVQKYAIPTHSPLWDKKFLRNKKLFNENLTMSEDLEFHSRNLPPDFRIVVINEVLFFLRRDHESITSEFYNKMKWHFDSYFFVRTQIIKMYMGNKIICNYFLQELMGVFRYLLVLKDFKKANILLNFIERQILPKTLKNKLKIFKIYLLLNIVKLIGRGETKFKRYFYLAKTDYTR